MKHRCETPRRLIALTHYCLSYWIEHHQAFSLLKYLPVEGSLRLLTSVVPLTRVNSPPPFTPQEGAVKYKTLKAHFHYHHSRLDLSYPKFHMSKTRDQITKSGWPLMHLVFDYKGVRDMSTLFYTVHAHVSSQSLTQKLAPFSAKHVFFTWQSFNWPAFLYSETI